MMLKQITAWKDSIFGVFLVHIFPAFGLNMDQKNSEDGLFQAVNKATIRKFKNYGANYIFS